MKDIRIYYYSFAVLKKLDYQYKKQHKQTSITNAEIFCDNAKSSIKRFKDTQFVIIEYTGNYKSKIIKII